MPDPGRYSATYNGRHLHDHSRSAHLETVVDVRQVNREGHEYQSSLVSTRRP
ncbi:hypothetical protein [Actinomadura rugatobispora]|uniref:Uncharacterized protein n=1 Tax=Actinomadura rugatobispora TaxID=1994 RepID=A0ABW1AK00_9ACTN|nr:hypothetical protein GCM10010200_031230 [Actinomadura rugatobispora]